MRKLLWILSLVFLPFILEARNQVSGYISLKSLGGNTYQATVVDYTLGPPCDTIPTLDTIRFWWGDGTSTLLYPSNGNGDSVCDCRNINLFVGTHTYRGPGNYKLAFLAEDRNANIQNIGNSVNQQMLIFNTLTISPLATYDSTLITNPPVCTYGCLSKCYNFNLGAYSPGGDSLSYLLGNCLGDTSSYFIPSGASVNPVTGEFTWCNPDSLGLWNFSIRIVTHHRAVIDSVPIIISVDTEEVELQVNILDTCAPASITPITNNGGYTIYPNPSKGIFTIALGHAVRQLADQASQTITIYNALGETVYIEPLKQVQGDYEINLSNQPNGVYLYRILNSDATLLGSGKIIVQK